MDDWTAQSVGAVTQGLRMPALPLITPEDLCKSLPLLGPHFLICKARGLQWFLSIWRFLSESQKQILLWLMDRFMMWIVVMVSWVYTYVKAFQMAYFKYVQFIVCHVYLDIAF